MSSKKKKIIIGVISIFSVMLIGFFVISCFSILFLTNQDSIEGKYPWGRDTEYQFGDGRYQILRGPNFYSFLDADDNTPVDEEIIEWQVYCYHDITPYAYIIGETGYTVLNYETGEKKQKSKISDMPEEHQKVFKEKDKFIIP